MLGRTIANYKIVEKLGQGGMGVVYKALDIRLNRFLALKFLKPEDVTDDRRRRFHQEAKASSALNHPSITHIYDIGEWEGSDFIAMEYVEGTTLQQILKMGALPIDEALRYAIQVADAMSVAHAAGIVHRDLKPANVMVTPRGLVKILDFGVAKLKDPATEPHDSPESTDTQTMADAPHTVAGKVVGSPSHMSPEQSSGKPVDARSDIFAFGVLLQEMLTGKPAFSGRTTLEVLSAILQVEPPKPSTLNAAVTPELDWIVARCLRKDPERRFQAMTEVKVALEDLRTTQSGSGIRSPVSLVAIPQAKKRIWAVWAGFALALGCAVGLGFALLYMRPALTARTGAPADVTRLTTEAGLSVDPAISGDGKFLAYASDRSGEGNMDIWVKQIDGGEAIRLTRNVADDVEPAFSPDGTKIVFRSAREGGGLYIIPTLGGKEYKIADGGRQPQFSPDGTKIAYWTGRAEPYPLRQGHGQLFVLDLTNSSTRQIRPDFSAAVHPVWSPDGKSILFVGLKDASDVKHTYDWWIAPLEAGGQAVKCPVSRADPEDPFDPFAWRRDRVYFSRPDKDGWRIGEVTINPKTWQPAGSPRALTAGTTNEHSPSVSKDGRLVFSSILSNPDIYSLPLDPNRAKVTGPLERLTRDAGDDLVLSISADGKRISYLSNRTGAMEVWVKDLGTGDERALTTGSAPKDAPFISPDGRMVAWRDDGPGHRQIFLTPFEGGIPVQVCADCGVPTAWSADARFLAYVTPPFPRRSAGLLEVSSRKASEYLKDPRLGLLIYAFSNDGKWLALTASRIPGDFTVFVAPFDPDHPPPPSKWVEIARFPEVRPLSRWSPDGNLLYFISDRDGHACIWAQRLDPATKHPKGTLFAIQHFHAVSLPLITVAALTLAKDKIVVTLNERSGGIWMLKLAE